jgi:Lipase (class 3)
MVYFMHAFMFERTAYERRVDHLSLVRAVPYTHHYTSGYPRTILTILKDMRTLVEQKNTPSIVFIGHSESFGVVLVLLDAVYLNPHLPADTHLGVVGYGMRRLKNDVFADYIDGTFPDAEVMRINNREDTILTLSLRDWDSGLALWVTCSGRGLAPMATCIYFMKTFRIILAHMMTIFIWGPCL